MIGGAGVYSARSLVNVSPDQERLLAVISCLCLLSLAACATTAHEPASRRETAPGHGEAARAFDGVWDGSGHVDQYDQRDLRLMVNGEGAWLEIRNNRSESTAQHRLTGTDGQLYSFTLREPSSGDGFKGVTLQKDAADKSVLLRLQLTDGSWTNAISLSQPTLAAEPTRLYASGLSSNPGFIYRDWQSRVEKEQHQIVLNGATERLQEAVEQLRIDGGWRCLARVDFVVSESRRHTFNGEGPPGIARLYLIYSPAGNNGLTYQVGRSPAGYTTLYGEDTLYPLVLSDRGWTTHLGFYLRPTVLNRAYAVHAAPTTILVFGRMPGDYGSGCNLKDFGMTVTSNPKIWEFGIRKILYAYLFEAGRRLSVEGDGVLLQLVSTLGRNWMVSSSLQDIFLGATAQEIDIMARAITLLMSKDFAPSIEDAAVETARGFLVQWVDSDFPDFRGKARFADLLLDLYLQRREHQ